jgi:hypothetical protein
MDSNLNYSCIGCNYDTYIKCNYIKHLKTQRHLISSDKSFNNVKKIYECDCGNVYKHRQSLNAHKKKCFGNNCDNYIDKELIMKLVEQNSDLIGKNNNLIDTNNNLTTQITEQNKMLTSIVVEQQKQISNKTTNSHNKINTNTNTNSTNCNNKFNIQLFLNEQCKDAISIEKFIEDIQISIQNLLVTKDKGLAEGISNIFIENMNKLPITQRPLHCTDVKRETLYIKNQEKWEKDDDNKKKIKSAIKSVSIKQTKNLVLYKKDKPNFMNNRKEQEDFIHIVNNTTASVDDKEEKVIKNICKNVYINEDSIHD